MFRSSESQDATTRPDVPFPAMTILKLSESQKVANEKSVRSCKLIVLAYGKIGGQLVFFCGKGGNERL